MKANRCAASARAVPFAPAWAPRFTTISLLALLLAISIVVLGAPARARMAFSAAEPVPLGPRPEFLAVADLNGDGRDDLVVVSPASDKVQVLLGATSSSSLFENVQVYPLGRKLRRPAVGDLDEDGTLDIAVADESARGVWVLPGRGDGSFTTALFVPFAGRPSAVAIGDFDAAAGADLVIADRRAGTLAIVLNSGDRQMHFRRGPEFAAGPGVEQVAVADLDGDGGADVVCLRDGGRRGSDVIAMYWQRLQSGAPVFGEPVHSPVGIGTPFLDAVDFDGDARTDVVVLLYARLAATNTIEVMLSTAERSFAPAISRALGCPLGRQQRRCRARGLAAADFDRDGRVDVAIAQRAPRQGAQAASEAIALLRARGDGVLVDKGLFPGPRSPLAVASGDFNGDGLPDIAVTGRQNSVQVLINLSSPGTTPTGSACLLGDECVSGLCTNGVCCSSACAEGERCDLLDNEGVCALP